MKRILAPLVILSLGIVIGVAGSYFAVIRGQSEIIQTCYAGSLSDRVILSARLRAGQQERVLAETDAMLPGGVLGLREIAGGDKFGRYSLSIAKAYYRYLDLPMPAGLQPLLADVEPVSRQSFEKIRDFPLPPPR